MLKSIVAVSAGASAGAILRWALGLALNSAYPLIPMGTLAANLLGGYCIGLVLGAVSVFPEISPEWRLFIMTGFLGALTTFSTFSAETVLLLQQNRFSLALTAVLLHVCGSLLMTLGGLKSFDLLRKLIV